jgi:hypothetical protein
MFTDLQSNPSKSFEACTSTTERSNAQRLGFGLSLLAWAGKDTLEESDRFGTIALPGIHFQIVAIKTSRCN